MDLTVGQVSGIIAVGVVVVRTLFPNLLALLFLGTLREHNGSARANAISWSSISRFLHSSDWPTVLNSDTATFNSVSPSVAVFRCIGLLGTLLISIAAITTPLGLHEAILADRNPTMQLFHYAEDNGLFGQGTPARNTSLPWSRVCGLTGFPETCPDLTRDSSSVSSTIPVDRSIPDETIAIFQSGVSGTSNSISSIADIQWRLWTWQRFTNSSNAPSNTSRLSAARFDAIYPIGEVQHISTLALNDKYEAVEGLVVDTIDGGIGFRNHSVPPVSTYGSNWSEELLFIQPVTACVNTNLTLEYRVPQSDVLELSEATTAVRLIDRGGFSQLDQSFPQWDQAVAQTSRGDIWTRAYQAAWLNNVYVMGMLNVTRVRQTNDSDRPIVLLGLNSTLNQQFPLDSVSCNGMLSPRYLSFESFGCLIPPNFDLRFNLTSDVTSVNVGNDIKFKCEATRYRQELGKMQNLATYCTLALGAGQRIDSGYDSSSTDITSHPLPGTVWSKPIYSCAMGAEARIKTVTFSFNSSDDNLSGLTVQHITDKTYSTGDYMPLWGVKNIDYLVPSELPPLWGLVSPEAAKSVRNQTQLQTIRKDALLLPSSGHTSPAGSYYNMPGTEFYENAFGFLEEMYLHSDGVADYSGMSDLAMARRWSDLSRSERTMPKILNLIWTDGAANMVVGTKGSGTEGDDPITKPVIIYRRKIQYELAYAVPAIIVLTILALITGLTLIALPLGRTSVAKMSRYLNATSAGRILTATLQSAGQRVNNDSLYTDWVERDGKADIFVGKNKPVLVSPEADGRD